MVDMFCYKSTKGHKNKNIQNTNLIYAGQTLNY